MTSSPIQSLVQGIFCAFVAFVGTPAPAQMPTVTEVDRLERSLRRAHEGFDAVDYDLVQSDFDRLKQYYEWTGRLQELAWLHRAYGIAAEADRLESHIERTLRTAPITSMERLHPQNGRVHKIRFSGGLQGLTISPDRRFGLSSADPRGDALTDKRRHAVAVYHVDRILGFRLVPVTTTRKVGDRLELVRAFIADARPTGKDHRVDPYDDERLHVLDYITEQIDRNPTGALERPGGELVAPDNRHSLTYAGSGAIAMDGPPPSSTPPPSLSSETRLAVLALQKVLERDDPAEIPGTTLEEIRAMRSRVAILVKLPKAPTNCDPNLTAAAAVKPK